MSEKLKSSTQIALESGLSKERVNQFARKFGVQKIGSFFVWNEADEKLLYARIGMRGRKLKS
jgi:hypothetical protein